LFFVTRVCCEKLKEKELKMKKITSIPLGVLLIAGFYIFGALVLMVFLFTNPAQASSAIAERHGLPISTGNWILPVIAGLGMLIAYGLISLSKWGYALTMLYLVYFGVVNGYMLRFRPDINLLDLGSLVWAVLVIIYLLIIRKRFNEQNGSGYPAGIN